MKKIISFVFLLTMSIILFAFTSCELLELFTSNRTTITEAEWYKNMELTNYTLSINEDGLSSTVMVADNLLKIRNDLQTVIYDIDNGYTLTNSVFGWVAVKSDGSITKNHLKLGVSGYFPTLSYEDLVYNSSKKAYTIKNGDFRGELYFQDGVLTSASITYTDSTQDKKIVVAGVGTTSIEIEEYKVMGTNPVTPNKADKDAVTTVTKEEWLENVNSINYTVNAYFPVWETMLGQVEIQSTETAMKQAVSIMGTPDVSYYSVIDGVPYKISKKSNGKYVAILDSYTPKTLMGITGLKIYFEELVYNEVGRYYVVSKEEGSAYFYFENAKLYEVIVIPNSSNNQGIGNIVCVISDLGTTEIALPEYTLEKATLDLDFKLNAEGTGYVVTGMGTYKGTSLIIPEVYRGLPVVAIKNDAFKQTTLTHVVIPNSVTSIGDAAFRSCRSLVSVIIGNSVTSIGSYAFDSCESIKNIIIPDSVISLGDSVFESCNSLESVTFGNSLNTIGDKVFYSCDNLANINWGNSLKYIGSEVFSYCKNITEINMPDSVISIGDKVFMGCERLAKVTLSNSLTYMGYNTFADCELISSIVVPKSVMYMGSYLFANCESVKIYCEANERPVGWSSLWNYGVNNHITGMYIIHDVEWGYIPE